jgi:hypothetical protein
LPGTRLLPPVAQPAQLGLTADERRGSRSFELAREIQGRGAIEGGILMQNGLVHRAKLRSGLDADLVRERLACLAVGLERLGLAPAAVERKHQLAAQPLTERVTRDECFELPDEVRVAAEREPRVEPHLEGGDGQLVEPRSLEPGKLLLVEVCERRTVPERQRLGDQLNALRRIRVSGFAEQPLESVRIDVFRFDRQPVAGRLCEKNVAAKRLAQRVDGVLERAGSGRGCALAPEVGNEPVGGNDLSCPQRERGKECPLLAAGQGDRAVALARFERPEQAYLHPLVVTPATNVSK